MVSKLVSSLNMYEVQRKKFILLKQAVDQFACTSPMQLTDDFSKLRRVVCNINKTEEFQCSVFKNTAGLCVN